MNVQGPVRIIQRTLLDRIRRQFVKNERQRGKSSAVDQHFVAIDDEVFAFSSFPKGRKWPVSLSRKPKVAVAFCDQKLIGAMAGIFHSRIMQ